MINVLMIIVLALAQLAAPAPRGGSKHPAPKPADCVVQQGNDQNC